jgi:hypothetical protein
MSEGHACEKNVKGYTVGRYCTNMTVWKDDVSCGAVGTKILGDRWTRGNKDGTVVIN